MQNAFLNFQMGMIVSISYSFKIYDNCSSEVTIGIGHERYNTLTQYDFYFTTRECGIKVGNPCHPSHM